MILTIFVVNLITYVAYCFYARFAARDVFTSF